MSEPNFRAATVRERNRDGIDVPLPDGRGSEQSFVIWLIVLTALGGALRFAGLGDRDFWFDESCTFIYVHQLFDWPENSSLLVESTNLPYYAILRGWVALFGDSEAAYRALSALAATLVIPLLGLLGRRLGGAIPGIIAATLAAFNPLHIHYAHEARAYAAWTLLLSIALLLLYEAGRRSRWRWWGAYGLVALACLHLHYFTGYWLPATLAIVLIAEDRRRVFRQWLVTHVAIGIGFVPYFLAAVWPAAQGGGSAWLGRYWEPLTSIPRTLWAFLPAGGYPAHLRGLSLLSVDTVRFQHPWLVAANVIARVLPAVVVVCLVMMLVGRECGRADRVWSRKRSHLFLALMTLGPLALAWGYSLAVQSHYLVGRYDLVAWPAFVVWLALIIAHLAESYGERWRGPIVRVVVLLLVGSSLVPIGRMAALKPPPSFHHVRAQRLAELTGPDDLVIALSYDRDYLLYYLFRAEFAARIVSFPSWLDGQIGWVDTDADIAAAMASRVRKDAAAQVEVINAVISGGGRVFLLADSIEARGSSARTAINQHLLVAAGVSGFETQIVDDDLLILEFLK